MAGVILLSRSTRQCESINGNARTFSEQVIASITFDSRCGMSDVAFRTPLPIGGPSCPKNQCPMIGDKIWELVESSHILAILLFWWRLHWTGLIPSQRFWMPPTRLVIMTRNVVIDVTVDMTRPSLDECEQLPKIMCVPPIYRNRRDQLSSVIIILHHPVRRHLITGT